MISEIDRFHNAVHDSVELRLALQSLSGLEDFVTFANARGYNFTVPELHEWNKKKRKGELSESELEFAAGGGSDVNVWQAIKSVMFGSDSSY